MSPNPTPLDERFSEYIADRTAADDAFLIDLKKAALEAGIPQIWINAAQASLMQILLKLNQTNHAVEVGTLAGYSAICMARALPASGQLTTIELEDQFADFAKTWIAKSDVSDKIRVLRGAASDILKDMKDQSADACFIDADKEGYANYLNEMKRILKPGSLVMVDNAFAFGELFDPNPTDPGTPAIRNFNDYMAGKTGFTAPSLLSEMVCGSA